MVHMTNAAKERKETCEAKFKSLARARQNLTEDRQNEALQQQYENAKQSLKQYLNSIATAAEERNTENYYTLG